MGIGNRDGSGALLGTNLRANFIFVSAQPDCVAALLALSWLYFWARPRTSIALRGVAVMLFLTAIMFKQTSAAFALIPPAKILLWDRPFGWRKLLGASLPALCIVLQIGFIYLSAPLLFHAMVAVPAGIHVHLDRAATGMVLLLATFPFCVIGLTVLLARPVIRERERWLCSALAVLLPIGAWTFAKSGGDNNSLLWAFLALAALAVSQLPSIVKWMDAIAPSRALFAALALGGALIASYFFQFDRSSRLLFLRDGDEKIGAAIAVARAVGGVVSPQDPSIAYRASGYLGHSAYFELDNHATAGEWPAKFPGKWIESWRWRTESSKSGVMCP